MRILPTYWCALLLYLIPNLIFIKGFKVRGFIADLFGLGFLTSKSYNFWFVPSIVICYLSFPAIICLLNKGVVRKKFVNSFWSILFLATLLPSILCAIAILTNKYQLLIFFARLPSFVIGILIGYLHFENKVENSKDLGLNFLASFLIFIIGGGVLLFVNSSINIGTAWRYGLLWYPFIFITFPLCLLLAYLVDWFNKYFSNFIFISIIKKCLVFCGIYSLEIYLAHVLLFQFANNLRDFFASSNTFIEFGRNSLILYLILFSFSLMGAVLIKRATRLIEHITR